MDFHLWITLLLASFVISISPGAGAVLSMSSGVKYGLKRSYATIFGLQLGYLIQAFIVIIGLGALIVQSVFLFNIIKWIGVLYLVYLGLSKIFEKVDTQNEIETLNAFNAKKSFINATLINLTNPKATLFLVAFIPQFINTHGGILPQFLIIGGTLCMVDIIVMTGYSSMASKLKFLLKDKKSIIIQNRVTGLFLILAATFLATAKK